MAAIALSLATSDAWAAGDDKKRCLDASDQGQLARDEGKYRLAREDFTACARESCPAPVRRDCLRWLSDLESQTPTVVVSAKDGKGNDLVEVQVQVDGAPLVSRLDGKPMAVDPGEHVFHSETPGFAPVDERVVVHAGEKSRVLTVQFTERNPPAAFVGPSPSQAPESAARSRGGPPIFAWVLAGVALAAFGSEAYFGVTGVSQRSEDLAAGGCAPNCSDSEKNDIQTKFLVADVSLGVGVVSAAVATYLFLSSHGSSAGATRAARFDARGLHF